MFCIRLTRRFSWFRRTALFLLLRLAGYFSGLGRAALFLRFRLRLTRRFSWLGRTALFLCFRPRLTFTWLAALLTIAVLVLHIRLWQRLLLAFNRLRPWFFYAAPRLRFRARDRFSCGRFPLAFSGFSIALLAR